MPALILVMLGGAFGSDARFLTGKLTLAWFGPNYPWGTLAVNLIGGFLMGVFVGITGSVFSTYSTLYRAKDNEMLLAMPIRDRKSVV